MVEIMSENNDLHRLFHYKSSLMIISLNLPRYAYIPTFLCQLSAAIRLFPRPAQLAITGEYCGGLDVMMTGNLLKRKY